MSDINMFPTSTTTASSSALQYVPPPPPTLNGGLYTGTPFEPNAPWRNYPVKPDAGYYNFGSLAQVDSAPPAARYMMPGGGLRPGNSTPLLPAAFANSRVKELNAICIPASAFAANSASCCESKPNQKGLRQYAYL
jgi:hypothetical protein